MARFDDLANELHNTIGRMLAPMSSKPSIAFPITPYTHARTNYNALAKVSRTSKRYYELYTPHLYRSISRLGYKCDVNAEAHLLLTLLSKQAVATSVEALDVKSLDLQNIRPEVAARLSQRFFGRADEFIKGLWSNVKPSYLTYRLLELVLEKCHNLKDLRVDWHDYRDSRHMILQKPNKIFTTRSLRRVEIDGQCSATGEDIMQYIVALSHTIELELSYCNLGDFWPSKGESFSSVGKLNLARCRIKTDSFMEIFQSFPNLQDLTVSVPVLVEFAANDFEAEIMMEAHPMEFMFDSGDVVRAAQRFLPSLKHLTYYNLSEDDPPEGDYIGDIRGFKSLESLTVCTGDVLVQDRISGDAMSKENTGAKQSQLGQILPISLKRLEVEICDTNLLHELCLLIEDPDLLPNLTELILRDLWIECSKNDFETMVKSFESSSRKVGIDRYDLS